MTRRFTGFQLLVLLTLAVACGRDGSPGSQDDTAGVEAQGDETQAESLFGEWGEGMVDWPDGQGEVAPGDVPPSDTPQAEPGQDLPPGETEAAGAEAGDEAEAAQEVAVPTAWDVFVLTAVKNYAYKNGTYFAAVPGYAGVQTVAMDGYWGSFYALAANGKVTRDADSLFKIDAAGTPVFLDLGVASPDAVFTLEASGQVRKQGKALVKLTIPAGESFVALAAEGDAYYAVTNRGTVFEGNAVVPGRKVPVEAGDQLVAARMRGGVLTALTGQGKVYRDGALQLSLAGKAQGPFVGVDVDHQQAYVLTRDCAVYQGEALLHQITPFTGDFCVDLALVEAL
jgi:hypothetical protein